MANKPKQLQLPTTRLVDIGRISALIFVGIIVILSSVFKLKRHRDIFIANSPNSSPQKPAHKSLIKGTMQRAFWFKPEVRISKCHQGQLVQHHDQYDIAKLFNIVSFSTLPKYLIRNISVHSTATSPNTFPLNRTLADSIVCTWPDSVFARYHQQLHKTPSTSSQLSVCPSSTNVLNRPSAPVLRNVLSTHPNSALSAAVNSSDFNDLLQVVSRNDTILVQIDPFDTANLYSRTSGFIRALKHHARHMAVNAIVPFGAHPTDVVINSTVILKLQRDILQMAMKPRTRGENTTNNTTAQRLLVLEPPRTQAQIDAYLVLFSRASKLLVHRGPGAVLATLAAGKAITWHTKQLYKYTHDHEFHWQVAHDLREVEREPFGTHPSSVHQQWRKLGKPEQLTDTCCTMEQFAEGDGEKYLCSNAISSAMTSADGCWILSIGCGGLFDFERLMVNKFPRCKIHLFDCTGNWKVPADIAHAVTLHKLCVGNATHGFGKDMFKPLRHLIGIGGNSTPALFKFDAEGIEFSVLSDMVENTPKELLPQQMVIEFHLRMWRHVSMFERKGNLFVIPYRNAHNVLTKLHEHGYRTVYRADNPGDDSCTELTLVLDHKLPARSVSKDLS